MAEFIKSICHIDINIQDNYAKMTYLSYNSRRFPLTLLD